MVAKSLLSVKEAGNNNANDTTGKNLRTGICTTCKNLRTGLCTTGKYLKAGLRTTKKI